MGIIATVAEAIQSLFHETAAAAAQDSAVVQRVRKFTPTTLLQTFVMGFLKKADARDEDLAATAAQLGVVVTAQAIAARHSDRLAAFLRSAFERVARQTLGSQRALAPLWERFSGVLLRDASTVTLPDGLAEAFPGCGGSHGGGRAALKLQTEFDLKSGQVTLDVEAGKNADARCSRQHQRADPGSLTIKDLGYFDLAVMAEQNAHGEYFLSRLQFGTTVNVAGAAVDVLDWLARQPGPVVECVVSLGQAGALAVRLFAFRVPQDVADRRRRKLRATWRKKKGREPSARRLAYCDWTILVSNVPAELLTAEEAWVLYGARWQVELLFKRWKSHHLIAQLQGSTEARQMVRVWSRLLAALVQHWLILATIWGDPTKSLAKAGVAIRGFAAVLTASLTNAATLSTALTMLEKMLSAICHRDRRSQPGTFELLNARKDPDLQLT